MCRTFSMLALLFVLLGPSAFAQTRTTLYSFSPDESDGVVVQDSMIQARDGNFYGTASSGGTYNGGTIFRIAPSGSFSIVYTFTDGEDGGNPQGSLIQGSDGNLYGTTEVGGDLGTCGGVGCGTVFQVSVDGTLKTLHNFEGGEDGQGPSAGLVQGKDGAFYGVVGYGAGPAFGGAVFRITASGDYSILHAFNGSSDGFRPAAGLVEGSDGNFYGTTVFGGATAGCGAGCGTIFKITPAGDFTTVYSFTGNADGGTLQTGLIEGGDGNFYGVSAEYGNTSFCSPGGCGTVFRITPQGALTTLYEFTGAANSREPSDTLFVGGDGNFYGTTPYDVNCASKSSSICGTIFKATSSGNFSLLYSFVGLPPNSAPFAGLIQGSDGNFYGATSGASTGSTSYPATIYSFTGASPVPAPVQLAFSSSLVRPNTAVTLNWEVLNGFSTTLQQCFAFIQNDTGGAGVWTGVQSGTIVDGVYSGSSVITPTQDGTYTYALTCGGIESGFATLIVGTPPALTITTSTLPAATVGAPYSTTLAAVGGYGAYTWTIRAGMLPAGLTLAANTGAITGTPTAAGTDSFTVEVSDAETPAAETSASLTLQVSGAAATTAVQLNPSKITVGQDSTFTATVAGIKGIAVPTGTMQFQSNGSSVGAPVTLANGTARLLSPMFPNAGSYSITAVYSGDESYAPAVSAPVILTVTPPPPGAATLTANPATVTVSQPGDHGFTTLAVSRFTTSSITFSCAGLPVGATCTFGKLNGTGSSGNAVLEITTSAPYSSNLSMPKDNSSNLSYALALPGLITLGGLFRRRRPKHGLASWAVLSFTLACGVGATGCGIHDNGTPPGSYTVTVRAMSGSQSATAAITLVVQGK